MLKGLSLAALITALFREGTLVERGVTLGIGLILFVIARWLVRRGR